MIRQLGNKIFDFKRKISKNNLINEKVRNITMNMGISIKNSASNNKFFSPIQTPKFISNYQKYNLFKNTLSTKKGDVPIINISNEISSPRKSILSFDNSRKSCLILVK